MKKIVSLIGTLALLTYACTSTNQQAIDKQDSIQEAAAADSMLKSALQADAILLDSLKKDTIQ
jgi:hypothetical protein